MTRILVPSFLVLLLVPRLASAAIEVICGQFDQIHCGSQYGWIVIKCYSGTTGLQIDCNREHLAAKCAEAQRQLVHATPFSEDDDGVMCESGKLLGCFTSPPVPDESCGTPLDETNLVSCSLTQSQMNQACARAGAIIPLLPTGAWIALIAALLCVTPLVARRKRAPQRRFRLV